MPDPTSSPSSDKLYVDVKGPSSVTPDATSRPVVPPTGMQRDPMISGDGSSSASVGDTSSVQFPSTSPPKSPTPQVTSSPADLSISPDTSSSQPVEQPKITSSPSQSFNESSTQPMANTPMSQPSTTQPALPPHAMHKKSSSLLMVFIAIIIVLGAIIGVLLYYKK